MRKTYILCAGCGKVPYQLPEDGQLCLCVSVNKQLVKNSRQGGHTASESLRSILHVALV